MVMAMVWLTGGVAAADFWETTLFTDWSSKQVEQMLTDSPWSHGVTVHAPRLGLGSRVGGLGGGVIGTGGGFFRGGVGQGGGGVAGDGAGNLGGGSFMAPPRRIRMTVRWASALPVRQALLRRSLEGDVPGRLARQVMTDDPFYRVALIGVPPEWAQTVSSLGELMGRTALQPDDAPPIAAIDARLGYENQLLNIEFHFSRVAFPTAPGKVRFTTMLGQTTVAKRFDLGKMTVDGRLAL